MDILSIIGYVLAFALVIVSIMMGTDPDTGKTTLIVNQLKGFIDYGISSYCYIISYYYISDNLCSCSYRVRSNGVS